MGTVTLRITRTCSRDLRRFRACAAGATAIEYALIASVISIAIVTVTAAIGNHLVDLFDNVGAGFSN